MDKRELVEIITDVYSSLSAQKTSVFKKNNEVIVVRVVSKSFVGMTFSARFKKMDQMLKDAQTSFYGNFLFIYEAFTPEELQRLPKPQDGDTSVFNEKFKHSAQQPDLN